MRLKITACTGSRDKLWAIRYKRPKPNCHFWGTQSKSNVLHMIPAHSTIKGVGRHLSHLFSPTHWSVSTFAPFKGLDYLPTPPPPPQPPVSEQGHVLVVFTPKSKCTLLITWQSNTSETMCWGKKYNFFGKLSDQEDGRLVSQNSHLIWSWMPVSFVEYRAGKCEEVK